MLILNDKNYNITKDFFLGNKSVDPMIQEFIHWINDKYNVNVINTIFEKFKGNNKYKYRLWVIFKDKSDYEKIHNSNFEAHEIYQNEISEYFYFINQKYNYVKNYEPKEIFVTYNDFSEEAQYEANLKTIKGIGKSIHKKYNAVYEIIILFTEVVIFYYKNDDIILNEKNGISKIIKEEYFNNLKKNDEMNFYTFKSFSIKFDSKENLDLNYDGKLFNYMKSI